jgi:hypothetical protein
LTVAVGLVAGFVATRFPSLVSTMTPLGRAEDKLDFAMPDLATEEPRLRVFFSPVSFMKRVTSLRPQGAAKEPPCLLCPKWSVVVVSFLALRPLHFSQVRPHRRAGSVPRTLSDPVLVSLPSKFALSGVQRWQRG